MGHYAAGRPSGQARSAYSSDQQLFAFKQIRWWWNNHTSRLRQRRRERLHRTRSANALDAAIKKRLLPRIRLSDRRQERQPAEQILRSQRFGRRRAFLVGLERGRQAPLVDDTIALLAHQAFYSLLDRKQRDVRRRRHYDRDRSDVRLVLGRAPATRISATLRHLGRRRKLALRSLAQRQASRLADAVPAAPPSFGPFPSFPTLLGVGWSVKVTPKFSTERSNAPPENRRGACTCAGRSTRSSSPTIS